jgi:cell division protein FtsI (penicillin-binding protein 3)
MLVVIAAAVLALAVRVVDVQALGASKYASYGDNELYKTVALPALRGTVYDRNGNLLAVSVPRVDVVSDNYLEASPTADLGRLSSLLGIPTGTLLAKLGRRSGYVPLAYQVTSQVEAKIQALALPNLSFIPDTERVDPSGDLFSPLLGIVGFAGKPLSGLEYQRESLLAGRQGSERVATGASGASLPVGARDVHSARQGTGLVLTLDQPLQFEVTKVLSAQISATKANSGVVIVLDTRTGGILSMVSLVRGANGVVTPANHEIALNDQYQPGSVMKLATISGALQSGLISPTTVFTVPYQINVGGWPFQDAEYHPTEQLPVSQILAQSSNVGTIEIAHLLGPQRLYAFLRDLGFGQPTGLNWPGETAGTLAPTSQWSASNMGTVPIGTGEAVTPMQILDAYNAVANGGIFVPPRLVQATVSGNGTQHLLAYAPRHRVLAASTVAQLIPMLDLVTQAGTAILAQIPGYQVAGKTGTAQIPSTTGPGYQPGAWMATFVGFVPAQAPRLTAIVVLNHPDVIYGGQASAPVFSTIMRYALRHFDVSPPGGSTSASGNGTP